MRLNYLSYLIKKQNPVYGYTNAEIEITNIKSLENGDSCNVSSYRLENHWGTHIDCPAHFYSSGKSVGELPAETWFFKHPYVINLDLNENQIVKCEDLGDIPIETDVLLIKSGFYKYRGTKKYSISNPGIGPEVGKYLRQKYPAIRAIGFDFVSISPYSDRELGKMAHKYFLDPNDENLPILIIEDMDLSIELNGLCCLWAVPVRIDMLDSMQCTVIGGFKE